MIEPRMRSVVIDTDPGIDDAIAILWACGSPLLDIRALTTVGGNVNLGRVTQNTLDLLELAKHRAPVFAGARRPLLREPVAEPRVHGHDGIGGVQLPHSRCSIWSEPASSALRRILKKAPPGTVDLLTLGPLTNLATLLRTDPDVARRLGRVVAMGGAIDRPGNVPVGSDGSMGEFNITHDPEAAAEVFAAVTEIGLDLTLIPLDCTRQFRATRDWADALEGERGKVAGALINAYFDGCSGEESRPLHDPCVPLFAVVPELFEVERRSLDVDLGERPGMIVPGRHDIRVAMGIDAETARQFLAQGLA